MVFGQVYQLEVRQMGEESWDVSSPHYFIWTYPLNGYTYVSSRTGVWIAFIAQVSW